MALWMMHSAWVQHTTSAEEAQFPPLLEFVEGSSRETKNKVLFFDTAKYY